ncbi:uncharacterized protein LOC120183203 isoform X1 [Hibiscus syriacus]|uniref:uncharacterized protein LOC120183203 isoform X1 n=1 Tax=Hibiscus syriacus TaxID=106335 RepID=UPI00192318AD|nr:uncharacterized protein LOC120183203 isoform X1 [Hibiscus syriacus]
MGDGDDQDKEEFRENLTDVKLKEKIKRQERILEYLASKLPDKGKKIRDRLQQLEEGKKRRTFTRQKMLADECEKLSQPPSSHKVGKVSRKLGLFFSPVWESLVNLGFQASRKLC